MLEKEYNISNKELLILLNKAIDNIKTGRTEVRGIHSRCTVYPPRDVVAMDICYYFGERVTGNCNTLHFEIKEPGVLVAYLNGCNHLGTITIPEEMFDGMFKRIEDNYVEHVNSIIRELLNEES